MAQQECIMVSSDDEDAVSVIGALASAGSDSGGSSGGTFAIFGSGGSGGGASASVGSGGSGGGASASVGSGGLGGGASGSVGSGGSGGGASASVGSGGLGGGASGSVGSGGSGGGASASVGSGGLGGGASGSVGSGGSGGGASASVGSGGLGGGASGSVGSGGSGGGASGSVGSGGSGGGASASVGSGGSGGGASGSVGGPGGGASAGVGSRGPGGGSSPTVGSGGSSGSASSSVGSRGPGGGSSPTVGSGGSSDSASSSVGSDGVPYYVPRTLASRTSMTLNAKKWIAELAEKKRRELMLLPPKIKSQRGYAAEVARLVFKSELGKVNADDARLKNTGDAIKRLRKNLQDGKFDAVKPTGNRVSGAGRKKRVPNIRVALLDWFVDVRCSLKARLPLAYIQVKCDQLYQSYKKQMLEQGLQPDELKFTRNWVNGWCKEYRINLKKPSKRYKLKFEDRKRRVLQFLQNIWRVRHFMKMKFNTEPVIWSADQMPLHRNESSGSSTLNFTGMAAVVKENHSLSRERVTVFTQMSSNPKKPAPPVEFLFKGAGTRTTVSVPLGSNIKVQWAPKGSYRLANLKKWVASLPQILFGHQTQIVTLDNYSVHLDPSIRKELRNKGYILVLIGGGITGDIQVNDTHLHKDLKLAYRAEEADLNLRKLSTNPLQVPTASKNEMISTFHRAHKRAMQQINGEMAFKHNFISNALDGTEDVHVSPELVQLVGKEMKEFRETLIHSASPMDMDELIAKITPPEGVGLPRLLPDEDDVPRDEGLELMDGDLTSEDESDDGLGDDSDEFEGPNTTSPVVNMPAASTAVVTEGDDTHPAANVPADSNDDVTNGGGNSELLASNVRNKVDSGILKQFEDLSARKFGEGSSEMRPFFVSLNNLLKAEHKKISSRAILSSTISFEDVPFLPESTANEDSEVAVPSDGGPPAKKNRPERKKFVMDVNENWNGTEVWIYWPEGMDTMWAKKYWKAVLTNDEADKVTLNYTGEWELRATREQGRMEEGRCIIVETKHNLLTQWCVEVNRGFSL